MKQCPECGMVIDITLTTCPKCDFNLRLINRDKTIMVDIAHHHETVEQAIEKLNDFITKAKDENYGHLKIIVGNGLIREEIKRLLPYYQEIGKISGYTTDGFNRGAFNLSFTVE